MTEFGLYGSSRYAISSSVNSTLRAAAMVLLAPRIHERSLVITDHFPEVFQLCGANDGGSDLPRAPSKRNLGHLGSLLNGEFLDTGG